MIGIMCALEGEYEHLRLSFHGKKEKHFNENCVLSEGENNIIIIKSQIGRASAAKAAEYVIKNYQNVELILSTGIAGALSKELNIGDIVYAGSLLWYREGKTGVLNAERLPRTLCDRLENHEDNKKADQKMPKIIQATILSSDKVIQDRKEADEYQRKQKAVCVEMESIGVLSICNQYHIKFLAVKTISDFADKRGVIEMLRNQDKVMQRLSKILVEVMNIKNEQ